MIFAMVVPNIIGVVLLTPVVRKELNRYMNAIRTKHDALDEGLEDMQKHM
jgi:AGCS family alanine or glycine:cation symporter